MKQRPTIDIADAVDFLNELVHLDQPLMHNLVGTRYPCTEAIADHPTVQVQVTSSGEAEVGLLGILNGLFSDRSGNVIYAHFTNDNRLTHFSYRSPDGT